ncbi:MAG TPA: sulfur carrier protein ThiS [Jiangellaceae bacterium]
MNITVNGTPTDWAADAKLADVVASVTGSTTGVAVAVNDDVVPRGAWPTTALRPGDRVEVLTAVQGG